MTDPNTPDLLLELVHKMQGAASSYLEPATYVQRRPGGDSDYDRQVRMPAWNQAEDTARDIEAKRSAMFINDLIYMLDGPEQRAAEAAHTRPQPAVTVKPLVWETANETTYWCHTPYGRYSTWETFEKEGYVNLPDVSGGFPVSGGMGGAKGDCEP